MFTGLPAGLLAFAENETVSSRWQPSITGANREESVTLQLEKPISEAVLQASDSSAQPIPKAKQRAKMIFFMFLLCLVPLRL